MQHLLFKVSIYFQCDLGLGGQHTGKNLIAEQNFTRNMAFQSVYRPQDGCIQTGTFVSYVSLLLCPFAKRVIHLIKNAFQSKIN